MRKPSMRLIASLDDTVHLVLPWLAVAGLFANDSERRSGIRRGPHRHHRTAYRDWLAGGGRLLGGNLIGSQAVGLALSRGRHDYLRAGSAPGCDNSEVAPPVARARDRLDLSVLC